MQQPSNYGDPDELVEVDLGNGRFKIVKRSTLEEPVRHPKASEIYSEFQFNMGGSREGRQHHRNKPYVARGVPLNHPDAPHTDAMGRCIFTSAQEERDFMAKTGATNDGGHLEEGEYTTQRERDKAKQRKLPHEEAWQRFRKSAIDQGLLARPGEPDAERKRRQDDVLRRQDKARKKRAKAKG